MQPNDNAEQALLRRWVEVWRRATVELDAVRRREIETVDTKEAIRQIFGGPDRPACAEPTSGLLEQQLWFQRFGQTRQDS